MIKSTLIVVSWIMVCIILALVGIVIYMLITKPL